MKYSIKLATFLLIFLPFNCALSDELGSASEFNDAQTKAIIKLNANFKGYFIRYRTNSKQDAIVLYQHPSPPAEREAKEHSPAELRGVIVVIKKNGVVADILPLSKRKVDPRSPAPGTNGED